MGPNKKVQYAFGFSRCAEFWVFVFEFVFAVVLLFVFLLFETVLL